MPLSYATRASVKTRMGISDTSADALLDTLVAQINSYVEGEVGLPIGPDTTTTYTFDGHDALRHGRLLLIHRGVRSIGTLEVATETGGAWETIPSTDYFLRPGDADRRPGFPPQQLWLTDNPSSSNTAGVLSPGYGNIRITNGAFGFATIPDDVTDVAVTAVVRAFQSRQAGHADEVGADETGEVQVTRYLSYRDRKTLERYRAFFASCRGA